MSSQFDQLGAEALYASMMFNDTMKLSNISDAHKDVVEGMKGCHPIKTASIFSALLTQPHLQASCIFLEVLVALALLHCKGTRKPSTKEIRKWFNSLNDGPCGLMVDPSEDLFTNTICLADEENTVFEGIWEGAGFYTQRSLDALSFPTAGPAIEDARCAMVSLLRLSTAIVQRRKLGRYEYGASEPVRVLTTKDAEWARRNRNVVSFSPEDLKAIGVDLEHLSVFGFLPKHRDELAGTVNGNTPLDRFPLAYQNGTVVLLAPTAVTAAIRLFLVEFCREADALEDLSGLLGNVYAELFDQIGILGASNRPDLDFEQTENGFVAGVVKEVDLGRWLNVVFVVDPFDGFEQGGLVNLANDERRFDDDMNAAIDNAYERATSSPNFKEMITVCVGCGIGRAISHVVTAKERANWRTEFLSAYDLFIIGQIDKTDPLILWHLLDAQDAVQNNDVGLHNINGLINLLAWSRSLGGHLIPHEQMPDDFHGENTFLLVDQNAQKELRFDVAKRTDRRILRTPYGETLEMRKISEGLLPDEEQAPLYAHEGFLPKRSVPMAYVATDQSIWWGEIDTPTSKNRDESYVRWQLLKTWLPRIAEGIISVASVKPTIRLLHLTFTGNIGDASGYGKPGTFDQSYDAIKLSLDKVKNGVFLEVGEGFERGVYNPKNVAEKALVTRAVEGFLQLEDPAHAGLDPERIVDCIVQNVDARQTHRYASMEIRDHIRRTLPSKLIKTSRIDEGALKLGLGWRVRDRSKGPYVRGVSDCTDFLNVVTTELTNDLRCEISSYKRDALIQMCLVNHEIAAIDREQWRRTSRAVLALRNNSSKARQAIIQNEFELNAVSASCRHLVEIAVCEAEAEKGLYPGKLDLARMMTRAMMIYHLGSYSNSIRWGAMEPVIRITPQGDIHANHDFTDNIVQPYAIAGASNTIDTEVERYPARVTNEHPSRDGERNIDLPFESAWTAEMGGTLEQFTILVESIEDKAVVQQTPVIRGKISELAEACTDIGELEPGVARILIDKLLLRPRPVWDEVDAPHKDKDIRFWRYRRQLSLVRRPLIALDESLDPEVIVAPGMLRESFAYLVGHYHSASFPDEQLQSKEMRRYASKLRDEKGRKFELKVKAELERLGWSVFHAKTLNEIIGKPLDRDYGDVDIIASSPNKGRILIAECKDLIERKSPSEIAELISKFQGKETNGKRDLLLKHLDRVEKLKAHAEPLTRYCSVSSDAEVEGWLIFSELVPLQWAWSELQEKSEITVFKGLEAKFRH